jgi:hypothetical protein
MSGTNDEKLFTRYTYDSSMSGINGKDQINYTNIPNNPNHIKTVKNNQKVKSKIPILKNKTKIKADITYGKAISPIVKTNKNNPPIKLTIKKILSTNENTKRHNYECINNYGLGNLKNHKEKLRAEKAKEELDLVNLNLINKSDRIKLYKSLKIDNKAFSNMDNLPDFNTGKKLLNPNNIGRLRRMITVKVDTPDDYIKLDKKLSTCDQIMNGNINIEKITCNSEGKMTIISENEEQKEILKEIIRDSLFEPKDVKIKNFTFSAFGINKLKETSEIMVELSNKDFRFKGSGIKVINRFSINKSKDAIIFSCDANSTNSIIDKPYIFIDNKRYQLKHFIELIQCYKCSKFGHKDCRQIKPVCPNCAEEHTLKDCKINYKPNCGNCKSLGLTDTEHSSWDVRCPYRLKWIKKQKEHG